MATEIRGRKYILYLNNGPGAWGCTCAVWVGQQLRSTLHDCCLTVAGAVSCYLRQTCCTHFLYSALLSDLHISYLPISYRVTVYSSTISQAKFLNFSKKRVLSFLQPTFLLVGRYCMPRIHGKCDPANFLFVIFFCC